MSFRRRFESWVFIFESGAIAEKAVLSFASHWMRARLAQIILIILLKIKPRSREIPKARNKRRATLGRYFFSYLNNSAWVPRRAGRSSKSVMA